MTQPDRITKRPERVSGSVTSISWIPSEAVAALSLKLGFDMGVAHYDQPPPDEIGGIESLLTMVGGRIVYAAGPFAALEDARR